MPSHVLDTQELYRRLDQIRRDAGMTWREVSRETGISPSTFTRIKQLSGRPDVDALVSLLVWMEMASGLQSLILAEVSSDDGAQ